MGMQKALLRASVFVALFSSFLYFGLFKPVRVPPPFDPAYVPPVPISEVSWWAQDCVGFQAGHCSCRGSPAFSHPTVLRCCRCS